MSKKNTAGLALVAVAALSLAACGNTEKASDKKVDTATSVEKPASSATTSSAASTSTAMAHDHGDQKVAIDDGFVKAKGADSDMTGVFGILHNTTDKAMKLESFSTDLDASKYEIHEVVDGKMQMKPGGIEIPANGTYELKPGGDHLMIMGAKKEIAAGDTVKVSLKFSDGTEVKDISLPVRQIASGQENYGADGGVQGNSGMSGMPAAPQHNHG